jgi:hypothetical protein
MLAQTYGESLYVLTLVIYFRSAGKGEDLLVVQLLKEYLDVLVSSLF